MVAKGGLGLAPPPPPPPPHVPKVCGVASVTAAPNFPQVRTFGTHVKFQMHSLQRPVLTLTVVCMGAPRHTYAQQRVFWPFQVAIVCALQTHLSLAIESRRFPHLYTRLFFYTSNNYFISTNKIMSTFLISETCRKSLLVFACQFCELFQNFAF